MEVLYVAFRVKFLRTGQHSFCLLKKKSKQFHFYLLLQKDNKLPKKPSNSENKGSFLCVKAIWSNRA